LPQAYLAALRIEGHDGIEDVRHSA
jgi:hypothetical protein